MNPTRKQVLVAGAFDDLKSRDVRFVQEASRLGELTVLLWSDDQLLQAKGKPPQFRQDERLYLLKAIRYVDRVELLEGSPRADALLASVDPAHCIWTVEESQADPAWNAYCKSRGLEYRVIRDDELIGFPENRLDPSLPDRKKVIVTGCYDWFHSGHVRFFEEASTYGDLYVVVGHDANIRLLKGEGRPLFPQEERRYLVGSIRFVRQALISTGEGWLDAEPEIRRLRPDIYLVNEDGDVPEKRDYCERHGIEYRVLKRTPAPGLPPRSSTALRRF